MKCSTSENGVILLDYPNSNQPDISLLTCLLRRVTERTLSDCCEHKRNEKGGFYCPLVCGDRKKQYSCNPMGEVMGRGQEEEELLCLLLNTKLEMWLRELIPVLITVYCISLSVAHRLFGRTSFDLAVAGIVYIYTNTNACICRQGKRSLLQHIPSSSSHQTQPHCQPLILGLLHQHSSA